MRSERPPAGGAGPSLPARTTMLAVLVIATALLLGGAAMLLALGAELGAELENAQRQRADAVAALVAEQGPSALGDTAPSPLLHQGVVQVVDAAGHVVWTSQASRTAPVADLRLAEGQGEGRTELSLFGAQSGTTLGARGVRHGDSTYTVLAMGSTRPVEVALRRDALSLLVAVPILAGLGGLATWLGVRRILLPVDAAHRSQRRFIADAGHELRSPVATLRAGLELLDHSPTELPELLPVLAAETLRLERLSDDLLLLARSDSGELVRTWHDVDLDDLVNDEVARLKSSADVQVQAQLDPVRVRGDAEAIRRVVRNLVENARAACRTRVGVGLVQSDGVAVLRVDDDGPGIPEGQRQRIFDRFVRLDEARQRSPGGTGLGLAIVAAAVGAHGGQVIVTESDGGGARFEVRLPAAPGPGAPGPNQVSRR